MSKIKQKVELAANIAIIVTAVLFVGILVQKYFFNSQKNKPPQNIQPVAGTVLNIPDFDWAQKSKTLVLGLQKGCHFCSESAPFYKRLSEAFKDKDVKLVAVLPTSIEESSVYFKELGINNIEIRQAPLANIQTNGTPTLVLTNDKGQVVKFWIGKLPSEEEEDVINQLNL